MSDETRNSGDCTPAQVIDDVVAHTLSLAKTWLAWDGQPRVADHLVYTPHKAIRRLADHLLDHLAELEARLAGEPPIPDHWHGSAITTESDLAAFTREDLDEARSRLTRLGQIWSLRLGALDDDRLDRVEGEAWTLRQVALHLGDSTFYADAVGDLGSRHQAKQQHQPARDSNLGN